MTLDIKQAVEVLRQGGVILYPTDTIWGIGCDATCEAAVQRVYDIKKRVDSKALLVLVDSAAKLQGYVDARFEQVNTRFERLDKKLGRYTTMLSSSTKSHSASYVVPSKGKVVVCMSCLLLKKSGLGHGGQRQFEA